MVTSIVAQTSSAATQTYLNIGLILFLGVVVILGYLGWRNTNTMGDFAIAGETLGPYLLGAAYSATYFSAATYVGFTGWSYAFGLSNLWKWLSMLASGPIALIIFAKSVRMSNIRLRAVSLPDWLGSYYDSQIVRVGVAIGVLFNILYIATQLTAGAQIFEVLLGWDYETGLAFITSVVTLYVLFGGTYADVYTDAIQAIMMAIMGTLIFLSVFWVFDWGILETFSQLSAELAAQDQSYVAVTNSESTIVYSATAIIAIFFMDITFAAQPQLFNKVLALDDPKNLRKMIVTYIVLTVGFIVVIFAGFYMRVLNPNLPLADQAIFVYVSEAFPPILTAALGLVILSAALSTTDGIYIAVSTAIGNDIFLKFIVEEGYIEIEKDRAEKISRYLAQATVIPIGFIAYLIVLNPPDLLGELIWVGVSGVASATVGPILFGLYMPNFVTKKGAIASVFSGMAGYIVIYLFTNIPSILVKGMYSIIWGIVVMLVVSALTKQESGVAVNQEMSLRDSLAKLVR